MNEDIINISLIKEKALKKVRLKDYEIVFLIDYIASQLFIILNKIKIENLNIYLSIFKRDKNYKDKIKDSKEIIELIKRLNFKLKGIINNIDNDMVFEVIKSYEKIETLFYVNNGKDYCKTKHNNYSKL